VVVTHAGVGSVLSVLNQGKIPVILPRRAAHGEMIDDHQVEFAELITARSLAVSVDPAELGMQHLDNAARLSSRRRHTGA
jgi:UDP-N-acetylglucosamine transferase subunit ALG13